MLPNYFDHAASTPVLPEVLEAMLPWLAEACGNEHSAHAWGRAARAACDSARESVAELIGAEDASQIVFTSGATEANNTVVAMFDHVVYSPFEHSSVVVPARLRPIHGVSPVCSVREGRRPSAPSGDDGGGSGQRTPSALVCQMAVSNETGEWFFPSGSPSLSAQERGMGGEASALVDATAAVGKVQFWVGDADFVSLSGHKLGAPKGVGALYLRDPSAFRPSLWGGGHEKGLRAGTLNVPGIVGLGVAARLASEHLEARRLHATLLRATVKEEIAGHGGLRVNESQEQSPFVLSLTCFGLLAEAVVVEVDNLGYGISAGAACGSRDPKPSPAHLARGMTSEESRATVRVSFGPQNTVESAKGLARALLRATVAQRG